MGIGEENAPFFSATGWYFIQGWGGGIAVFLTLRVRLFEAGFS